MKIARSLIALSLVSGLTLAADGGPFPKAPTFFTLLTTPLAIEGLTGDNNGNLYVGARMPGAGNSCPVWRINIDAPALVPVGYIPAPSAVAQCSTLGLAFDHSGRLYVADGARIYRFLPNESAPPTADIFVQPVAGPGGSDGVPGANGLAFDRDDNLWVSDGGTGQGRVWRVKNPSGMVELMFRIPPLVNGAGRGRTVTPLPNPSPMPPPPDAPVTIFANGLAFDEGGDLIVADTSRGALWKVKLDRHGNVQSRIDCDSTFAANTLCLENVLVAHPLLEGADGIALDRAGNIWVDANERNAVVVVDKHGKEVREIFRNAPVAGLRNAGPLEFPTSPFLSGHRFCTTSSDLGRRDNFPNTAGQAAPGTGALGKISCMDQRLPVPGATLPVH